MDRSLIDAYEAAPAKLRAAVKGLGREELTARPGPGAWSILEVVVHITDSDAISVDRMKPSPNVFQPGAEAGQHIGLKIDVAEFDNASTCRLDQPAALPFDAGITDGAFSIVPDRKFRIHW